MKLRLTAFAGKPNDEQWNKNFKELETYLKNNEGKYPRETSSSRKERILGSWLSNQRTAYKERDRYPNRITQERIDSLESLPGWSWDVLTYEWNKNFKELETYLKNNEGKYPRETSSSRKERILGSWLSNQRRVYRERDRYPNRITQERIDLLNSLRPRFSWDPSTDKWNENFLKLRAYVEIHQAYPSTDSGRLGTWMSHQRRFYKERDRYPDRITQERIDLLNSLRPRFSWDVLTYEWDKNFKELETYLTNNEGKYPGQLDGPLGTWLSNQRVAYKKKTLSKERIDLLNSLRPRFSWDPFTAQWNKNFEEWKKYIVEHNGRPNRGPLQRWALNIRAIGAETYKTHYRDRYDKLINYVEDPEFVGLIGKPKNIPKESLEWTWEINKIPKHWLVGKESEKIIFELFTKNGIFENPDICKIYNTPRTGCDFFRYENETLTFFEIKTTGLLDDQKNAIPNFDSLTSYQEKLRDLILDRSSLFKEGLTKLELEGVKKNFLDTAVLEGLALKSLLDPETGTHKDYESLKYCVIFCSFFEDPKDSGKYQIKFPATGYYEDSNVQRPHGLDEHILEVSLETLNKIKKNQRDKSSVTAKLRIGRWIKQ